MSQRDMYSVSHIYCSWAGLLARPSAATIYSKSPDTIFYSSTSVPWFLGPAWYIDDVWLVSYHEVHHKEEENYGCWCWGWELNVGTSLYHFGVYEIVPSEHEMNIPAGISNMWVFPIPSGDCGYFQYPWMTAGRVVPLPCMGMGLRGRGEVYQKSTHEIPFSNLKDHREQIRGATMLMYCKRVCSNSLYFPNDQFMKSHWTFVFLIEFNEQFQANPKLPWTWSLSLSPGCRYYQDIDLVPLTQSNVYQNKSCQFSVGPWLVRPHWPGCTLFVALLQQRLTCWNTFECRHELNRTYQKNPHWKQNWSLQTWNQEAC